MKNLKQIKIIPAALLAGLMSIYQVNAQTHGGGVINTGGGVGTAGTNHTFIGNSAGSSNVTSGTDNTFIGTNAGKFNTTKSQNTFLGSDAGFTNVKANNNTFIGFKAGYNTSPSTADDGSGGNVFVGSLAGFTNAHGGDNVFLGFKAGYLNSSGLGNICIGSVAGYSCTNKDQNIMIGGLAGEFNLAEENNFIGFLAGNQNTTGERNTYFGHDVAFENQTGNSNTIIGYQAGFGDWITYESFSDNTYLGSMAGFSQSVGSKNQFIGSYAGYGNTDANENVAIGCESLKNQSYANSGVAWSTSNVAIGNRALYNNNPSTTSDAMQNTAVGHAAGYNNIVGYNNSFLGYQADVGSSSLINSTAIGANAKVETNNTMILGDPNVSVGIGISGNTIGPYGTLHVFRDLFRTSSPTAAYIENQDEDVNEPQSSYGIHVVTHGINHNNYGIWGDAYSAERNVGGLFSAVLDAATNIGVYGYSDNANGTNVAVWGDAQYNRGSANFNVGIYGDAPVNPSWPATTGTGSFAGYFNGDLGYTGTIGQVSDSSFKINVLALENVDSLINQLNCHSYYYDTARFNNYINLSGKMQFGLLAQEVESVVPNLVINTMIPPKMDSLGTTLIPSTPVKMINYVGFIPLLIEGYKVQSQKMDSLISVISNIQEQNAKIDALGSELNNLKLQVASCCHATTSEEPTGNTGARLSVTLENTAAIILDQNTPNPFAEQTTITFVIPDEVKQAKIIFYEKSGRVMKMVDVSESGSSSLTVFAEKISSGIYTYSLIADGKLIDTKKMVCNK